MVDVTNQRVTVDLSYAQPTYFARVLGLDSIPVSVRAVAEAGTSSSSAGCSKPWFIPNTALSDSVPCTACDLGNVLVDPGTGTVTPWAQACLGTQFALRPGSPAIPVAPGEFFAIQQNDSAGGTDYRTNIATCSPETTTCEQFYPIDQSSIMAPTKFGVQDLISIHGTVSPDIWVGIGQYQHPNTTVSSTSHQLVTAVIWDACSGNLICEGPMAGQNILCSGKTALQVIGFAVLFVEGMGGGTLPGTPDDVIARLVALGGCSRLITEVSGIDATEVGPYGFPLRLIQTPSSGDVTE